MQIESSYKLEKAVSTDKLRPALNNIKLTKNHAIAANGHVLVIVPIMREPEDTAEYLRPDILTKARKVTPKRLGKAIITKLNGTGTLTDGAIYPNNEPEDSFPPLTKIFPTGQPECETIFNVELLHNLCDAMGCKSVKMQIFKRTQGYHIYKLHPIDTSYDSNKAFGILMGMKLP